MEKETFKVILGYDTDIEEINSDTISFTVSSDSQFRHVVDIARDNKMYLMADFTGE